MFASFQSAALLCLLELMLNIKRMGLPEFSYQEFLDLSCYLLQNWLIQILFGGEGSSCGLE